MAIEEPDAGPGLVEPPRRREFLGHPVGLPVIAFTEAFERFSYYGMQTLLTLYMAKTLLFSPHVERIVGFDWFKGVLAGSTARHRTRRRWLRTSSGPTPRSST